MSNLTTPVAAQLKMEHKPLKEHWSAHFRSCLDLNDQVSDITYKHHVAQLMRVYNEPHKGMADFGIQTRCHFSPMTKLYGREGVRSNAPEMDIIYKRREQRWDNTMTLTENIKRPATTSDGRVIRETSPSPRRFEDFSPVARQSFSDTRKSGSPMETTTPLRRPASASSFLRTKSRSSSPAQSPNGNRRPDSHHNEFNRTHSNTGKKMHKDAVLEEKEDLVLRGQYRFDQDSEVEIYSSFVLMLSKFDNHDILLILQDALRDSQAATMLEDYGGTKAKTSREEYKVKEKKEHQPRWH